MAALAKKTMRVVLSELKIPFYVRTALDQDHVIKLAELYEAGADLPLIQITDDKDMVDGRHRKEALILLHGEEHSTVVEVVPGADRSTLLARALSANEGGSKQPTRSDIVHTIRQMLVDGSSEKKVYELLPYPKGATRKYLEQARITLKKALIQKGKEDVANGLTVKEAAIKHGIEVNELKKAINPTVGVNQDQMGKISKEISSRYLAMGRSNQALVKRMIEGFIDGDVPEKTVAKILDQLKSLMKIHERRLADWTNRFEAAKKGQLLNWKDFSKSEEEMEAA